LTSITQNPQNDQDNDFLVDVLRERLQTQIDTFDSFAPPTQAQYAETAALTALTRERLQSVRAFATVTLAPLNAELRAAKLLPLEQLTKMPPIYDPNHG